jgi:hypothetical protein
VRAAPAQADDKHVCDNLLDWPHDHKTALSRFVFRVPFTTIRWSKITATELKITISGGFRTWGGAETFAIQRSVFSSARKKGWNSLCTVTIPPADLII